MRLALAQINPVVGDLEGNRDKILDRLEESRGSGADLAVFPELAPRLVRVLASGRADALAGRYIHAEHDDIEDLIRRVDEIKENDLNAIRLRR